MNTGRVVTVSVVAALVILVALYVYATAPAPAPETGPVANAQAAAAPARPPSIITDPPPLLMSPGDFQLHQEGVTNELGRRLTEVEARLAVVETRVLGSVATSPETSPHSLP